MPSRDIKRFLIIGVYLTIIATLGAGLYFLVRPAGNCFDEKQNQDETQVDCGGVCSDVCEERVQGEALAIREAVFISAAPGRYDIVARVYNPNNDIGAATFSYALLLQDDFGNELARFSGKSFILPQETKTLLAFNLESASLPAKVSVVVTDPVWQRLRNYREKPELNVYEKRYTEVRSSTVFGQATGTLVNQSGYDFRTVQIKVVLRDAAGQPVAANQTEMGAVVVGQERSFQLPWPMAFPGTVARVDVEVDTDVYATENFLRQHQLPAIRPSEGARPLVPAL